MPKPYAQLRARMTPEAQVQAAAQARAILAADTAPCDLCGTASPTAWLQPEAYQEWDALCPHCFCHAHAHSWYVHARHQARTGQEPHTP